MERYYDLRNAFGMDNIVQATTHFIEFGFNEGRNGHADVALTTQGGLKTINSINFVCKVYFQ